MTIKDIVAAAIAELSLINENVAVDANTPVCKLLIAVTKKTLRTLSREKLYFKTEKKANFLAGVCALSVLDGTPIEIIRLEKNGALVPFSVQGKNMVCNVEGEVTIIYLTTKTVPDDINAQLDIPETVTIDIVTDGVCAAYCYARGLTEEAAFYDQRYDEVTKKMFDLRRSYYIKGGR